VPADLLERSRGFRDLLEAVRERGGELDRREQALAARETALKALEKVLADEIARLEGLSGAPAAAGAAAPAEAPGGAVRGVAITKIYESMRAEEAAPIIGRLDDPTAHRIFARMKEKQIAAILAAMAPERAVELTRGLAGRDPAAQ
jgi:flagellar motility protein MotE (MotC chaperone)